VRARAGAAGQRFVACASETASDGAIAVTCGELELAEKPSFASLSVLDLEASRAIDRGEATTATRDALARDAEHVRDYLGRPARALAKRCAQRGPMTCTVANIHVDIDEHHHLLVARAGELVEDLDLAEGCDGDVERAELWGDVEARVVFVVVTLGCGQTQVWGMQLP
jgi:hypothetical protein